MIYLNENLGYWLLIFEFAFSCVSTILPQPLHLPSSIFPLLLSLHSVRFHQSSIKNSTRRSYIIRRIQKLRLHRLNQVSSSSSNCEGSSHHRSISPSLVLFYNYPLFLTSFQNTILLKYSLFHRLSLAADPLLSLLSSYSALPIPLVISSP